MARKLTYACMFLLACAGSASRARSVPRAEAEEQDAGPPAWKRTCEEYAGAPVTVSYEDAPGGASVVYRTEGNLEALRERSEEIARFHNGPGSKVPALHETFDIPHTARLEPVENGVKLVLVPKRADAQTLEELRRNIQQDVFLVQQRGCGRAQEGL